MADTLDRLSITANITGIMTFIAAIFAFIYVRYRTLKNSYDEIHDILASVAATGSDTATMTKLGGDIYGSPILKRLIKSLYYLEVSIVIACLRSLGSHPESIARTVLGGRETFELGTTDPPDINWQELENIIQDMYRSRAQSWSLLRGYRTFLDVLRSGWGFLSLVWTTLSFILCLGLTPTMVRWYKIRREVSKMVQDREAIRSQLLLHQVFAANA